MGKHSYGVVLDAGSSGTRVYVYRWQKPEYARSKGDPDDLRRLPEIKTKKEWHKKVHPGVSTFGSTPEDIGPAHLAPLIDFALDVVPKEEVANTPIFLLATAGVRLLPTNQRAALLSSVCSYFRRRTDFLLPDCDVHVQVIPGETEGLYGWIAANYLLGGFDQPDKHDHGKGHHTYGFLDMGGASAQIAFAPNATETVKHAQDLKLLRLRAVSGDALEYKVFVTTWLGFGANEARRRYVDSLIESYPVGKELPDPCLPAGLQLNKTGHAITDGSEAHLIGTGQFPECLRRTYPLLEKDKPCTDAPCLLNGIHTPAIDFDVNHFVGVSEFWHTTHEFFAKAHKDKAYDFHSYQKQVTDLCSRRWSDIELDIEKQVWGKKVDEKTLEQVCFKASWLINMLHDGIGVPRIGLEPLKEPGSSNKTKAVLDSAQDRGFLDPFQAVDKIEGTEVSWTLGKMVLYASSQVPPARGGDAVGFGSNAPGLAIPPDFQYPTSANSSSSAPVRPTPDLDQPISADAEDWHDRILSGSYSRRVPGILIFLLILALAVYLLCGRERRLAIYHRLFPRRGPASPGRRPALKRRAPPSFLAAKLFGGNGSQAYERVSTTADDPASAADLELGDVRLSSALDDDFHSPPRTGRTSGIATPATRGLSPDYPRTSPKTKGYFERASAAATPIIAGGAGSGGAGVGGSGSGGIGNTTSGNTGASAAAAAAGSSAAATTAAHGLGISTLERGAWSLRGSESKERLAPRSRNASPSRRSPLLAPFKESVD